MGRHKDAENLFKPKKGEGVVMFEEFIFLVGSITIIFIAVFVGVWSAGFIYYIIAVHWKDFIDWSNGKKAKEEQAIIDRHTANLDLLYDMYGKSNLERALTNFLPEKLDYNFKQTLKKKKKRSKHANKSKN